MKEFLEVTMLALLQGVAEFLPISSSGHLVILQHMLEVPDNLRMRLEVFLHAGTMISIFAFYAKRIGELFRGAFAFGTGEDAVRRRIEAWLYIGRLFVSTLPAVVIYFMFKRHIDDMTANVRMVGALLMFTGAVLIGTRFLPRGSRRVGWLQTLVMGVGQAIALLPGVSRSGMTIASARGGGVNPDAAAEFSFLMSAPLICGGVLLEFMRTDVHVGEMSWSLLLWGVVFAAVTGYLSLALLVKVLRGRRFWLFGPYCIVAGLCTLVFCR